MNYIIKQEHKLSVFFLIDKNLPKTMHTLDIDQPSDKDYKHEDLFGSVSPNIERSKIPFPVITIINQSLHPKTRLACGECGLIHIINGLDKLISKYKWWNLWARYWNEKKILDEWTDFLKLYPNAEWEGSTLQQNLEFQRKKGNITGYYKVGTKDEIKWALDAQNFIYSGSANGNWAKVKNEHIYEPTSGRSFGHIFCVVDYNDEGVFAINSYGKEDGVFTISWEIFLGMTYSKYAIVNNKWERVYNEYRASRKTI